MKPALSAERTAVLFEIEVLLGALYFRKRVGLHHIESLFAFLSLYGPHLPIGQRDGTLV